MWPPTKSSLTVRESSSAFLPKQVVSCLWKEIKNCCSFPVINYFPRVIVMRAIVSDYVHLLKGVEVVVTQDKFTVAERLMKM